jgi:hypothetical protein
MVPKFCGCWFKKFGLPFAPHSPTSGRVIEEIRRCYAQGASTAMRCHVEGARQRHTQGGGFLPPRSPPTMTATATSSFGSKPLVPRHQETLAPPPSPGLGCQCGTSASSHSPAASRHQPWAPRRRPALWLFSFSSGALLLLSYPDRLLLLQPRLAKVTHRRWQWLEKKCTNGTPDILPVVHHY